MDVALPSGLGVDLGDSLDRFFAEEWAYYDAIPDRDPDRVLPDDVLVTVAMNSFVNDANKVRQVHRGLSEKVDGILPLIPVDADLRDFDPDLTLAKELLNAACAARGVLLPVATKVLHRKRRSFIPMLDNVVLFAYLDALGRSALKAQTQDGARAGAVGAFVLKAFRSDLVAAWDELSTVCDRLGAGGMPVTPLRVLGGGGVDRHRTAGLLPVAAVLVGPGLAASMLAEDAGAHRPHIVGG